MFEKRDTIYLFRHGETVWNVELRKQGLDNSPLTDLGLRQAKAYAKVLKTRLTEQKTDIKDVILYSSPLGRTRETARYMFDALALPDENIHYDARLIEFDYGDWSGLTDEDIERRYPGELQKRERDKWFYRVPGGESYADVEAKIERWAAELPNDKVVLVVTHSVVSRVIRGKYLGLSHYQSGQLDHPQHLVFKLFNRQVETIDVSTMMKNGAWVTE